MFRKFATLAFVAALALVSSRAEAETLSLVGASNKICQLTGDTDWATGAPTAARTWTNAKLFAVDLGYPVDSGAGGLYFLFGDAWPLGHIPLDPLFADDAMGFTTRTAVPDTSTCLDMQLETSAPGQFGHPTVWKQIEQGTFNVPTGGVFLDGTLYAFFWTNHCPAPNALTPDPAAPLTLPAPSAHCTEVPAVGTSLGMSQLAEASPSSPLAFIRTNSPSPTLAEPPGPGMAKGFIYVSASERNVEFAPHRIGVPVFGVPRYRASVPYLAMAPRSSFRNPATWSYFAGLNQSGDPQWVSYQQWNGGTNGQGQWAPPSGAQIYTPVLQSEYCIGEHSVTWNEPLGRWLLVYNCGLWNIEARFAEKPWGPWSAPTSLLNLVNYPPASCTLIMYINGCGAQINYWHIPPAPPPPHTQVQPGFFYAPFVINRFTQDASVPGSGERRATIYWIVSTWNPYQTAVMQSTLALTP